LPIAADLDLDHSLSAFTTEMPTPCNPPDTLIGGVLELAPRVQDRQHDLGRRFAALLVDVDGIPRPLSPTEHEPSECRMILMLSQ